MFNFINTFCIFSITTLIVFWLKIITPLCYFCFLKNLLIFFSQISYIYDYNFLFLLFLILNILNILYTPLYVNKALYLYVFLVFMLFSLVIFSLNSFIGFLIVIELSTITFIVTLVYTFSNFFAQLKNNTYNIYIFIIFFIYSPFFVLQFNKSLNYLNFFKFYVLDCWNDFLVIYLYLYNESYFLILFIGSIFLCITFILIDILKYFFLSKISNLGIINNSYSIFFINLKKQFFQKNKNWQVIYTNSISKFVK